MILNFRLLNKNIYRVVMTIGTLSFWLAATTSAWADYAPPSPPETPSDYTTDSAGRRGGCQELAGIPLTALAPSKHVGQTVSTRPTFAWFVPNSANFPMEFKLYEYDENGNPVTIGEPISLSSSAGIVRLPLLEQQPNLMVGKTYLWQVQIICDPDNPSRNPLARADIKVVEMPPSLERELANTTEHSERVNLFGEAGLWYSALEEALNSADDAKLGDAGASLLEDLAKLEEVEVRERMSLRIEDLRQIATEQR